MSTDNHYDVIIIGSGAGGGTLAYQLAPSGKRILLLERGGYLPREKDNWDALNSQDGSTDKKLRSELLAASRILPNPASLVCNRQSESYYLGS